MNDFLETFKSDVAEIWKRFKVSYAKLVGRQVSADGSIVTKKTESTYEINLVPEVKAQMIKALKIRNLVLFGCLLVSGIAAGVVLVLAGIKGGQDIALSAKDNKLALMSEKLNGYSELKDLVTIQRQLGKYEELKEQKTVLSRVFGALGVMLSLGKDDVKMSNLRVNLETNVVTLEAQADAREFPLIDYRVLEAFKKSVELTKFDYGRYVDIDGKEIPTQCIEEADEDGNAYQLGDAYYAWWDLTIPGCEAEVRSLISNYEDVEYHFSATAEVVKGVPGHQTVTETVCDENGFNCYEVIRVVDVVQPVEGQENSTSEDLTPRPVRVKLWRTPQFAKWYDDGQLGLDGKIVGMEHFESECVKYKGTNNGKSVRWSSTNECLLVPKGLSIAGSSNARDESDNLVLKFTASAAFAEEFFMYTNKHMIAIGPMRQNVTDSYVQIGGMFTQEAESCADDDAECNSNKANAGQ